jgi:hypothetical protein
MFSKRLVFTLRSTTIVSALAAVSGALARAPAQASAPNVSKVVVTKASSNLESGYLRPHPEATDYFDVGFEDESLFNVELYVEKVLVTPAATVAGAPVAAASTVQIQERVPSVSQAPGEQQTSVGAAQARNYGTGVFG